MIFSRSGIVSTREGSPVVALDRCLDFVWILLDVARPRGLGAVAGRADLSTVGAQFHLKE